ncbi:hypothetical protein [Longimicrobium sp.]|uniref:hypothetical protein n=1 Tax=Longimicrobium sp. TaxID=2029185 RepID=UPI002E37CCB6|nr:hypothetical protein [Longimicrobium sp.]HEX6037651.1 hypothetical protein [Longimicrobium sp.]
MMTMKTLALAGLGTAALAVAATRSGAQNPAPGVPGTYTLAQVDGRALPTVVETDGACRDELVSATLVLADGTWTLEATERELCDGQAAREDRDTEQGRYTLSGTAVTFTDDDGDDDSADAADADDAASVDVDDLATGTLDGGTLTVRLEGGQTAVFRR